MTPWGWLGQWRWHGGSNDRFIATFGCGTGLLKGKELIEGVREFAMDELQAAFAQVSTEANGQEGVDLNSDARERARPGNLNVAVVSEWPKHTRRIRGNRVYRELNFKGWANFRTF
jgi:hypothetical protein